MIYNSIDEQIIDKQDSFRIIHSEVKEKLRDEILELLHKCRVEKGIYVRQENAVDQIMILAPMYANALIANGYKNMLFVGHYDAGRNIDWEENSIVKTNIVAQFIPIFLEYYGYDIEYKVVRPPESKHVLLMHDLYSHFLPEHNIVHSDKQYKHGNAITIDELFYDKFDLILFAGVEQIEETHDSGLNKLWRFYGGTDFDLMNVSEKNDIIGEAKNLTTALDITVSNRAQWDSNVRNVGCPVEYNKIKESISLYEIRESTPE